MLILLVLLIFFAALGIPLAFAIGASCVAYILIYAPTFITMLPQRVWNGAYSELMIAMPLFMLAGELMNTGGITQRIINFCMELLRSKGLAISPGTAFRLPGHLRIAYVRPEEELKEAMDLLEAFLLGR